MKIQRQSSGDNCTNIQAARDVHVHNHVSLQLLQTTIARMERPDLKIHEDIIELIAKGEFESAQWRIDKLVSNLSLKYTSELLDLAVIQSLISTEKSKALINRAKNVAPDDPNVLNIQALFLMDHGNIDEAEAKLIEAINTSNTDEIKEKIAGNLGVLYKNNGKYSKAIDNFKEAIKLATELGNDIGLINHLNNLGACNHNIGELEYSLEILQSALEKANIIIDSTDNGKTRKIVKSTQASILTNISISLKNKFLESQDNELLEKAKLNLERAIDIEESLGNKELLGRHYGNLAEIYRQKNDKDNHEKYAKKCFCLFESSGTLKDRLTSKMNMGLLFSDYEDYSESLRYFEELLSNSDLKSFPKLHVLTLINASHSYRNIDLKDYSEKLIKEAKILAENHGLKCEVEYIESLTKA